MLASLAILELQAAGPRNKMKAGIPHAVPTEYRNCCSVSLCNGLVLFTGRLTEEPQQHQTAQGYYFHNSSVTGWCKESAWGNPKPCYGAMSFAFFLRDSEGNKAIVGLF